MRLRSMHHGIWRALNWHLCNAFACCWRSHDMTDVRAQVALLFLTAGALFHERSWVLWFSQAADLLPLDSLLDASASSGALVKSVATTSPEACLNLS